MGLPEIAQSAKPTEESTPFPAVSATPINSPLRVGVKPIVPFVFAEGADVPYGYSIDLWNALAERLGVETTFVVYETVPELLDAVRDRQVDVAIAGISITQEREASGLDFSYPV
jgi:ABC-type amino acid transport substrate-binding protein